MNLSAVNSAPLQIAPRQPFSSDIELSGHPHWNRLQVPIQHISRVLAIGRPIGTTPLASIDCSTSLHETSAETSEEP